MYAVNRCTRMVKFQVLLIHVGNMNNKGTEALLKSDISVIKEVFKEVDITVSTTDIKGVSRLDLPIKKVLPPIVDIPYERADYFAKRIGARRVSVTYRIFAVGSLVSIFFQVLISVFSAVLEKISLKGFYRAEVFESIKNADVIISCSDENFKETTSLLPLNIYWILTWWSMLFSRTWDVLIVKFFGKPIIMFPNSIGPFRTRLGRFLARLALDRMNGILVREPISYKIVSSLGVKSPKILTFDTALLTTTNDNVIFDRFPHPLVGVSPGFYVNSLSKKEVDRYIVGHARALDDAIEKHGFYVVFLPHYVSGFKYDDLEVCKAILWHMRNKERAVIYEADSVEVFKSVLSCMDLVISSKMHPAVLAISGCVPTLCIAYDQKQRGFFQCLGLEQYVFPIQEFSYGKLILKIKNIWFKKDEIRIMLKEKVTLLQQNVKEAIDYAFKSFIDIKSRVNTT